MAVAFALLGSFSLAACKETPQPTGLVVADAAVAAPPDAGPVDIAQCVGCQGAAAGAWTFEGIYRDPACTDPVAQLATAACAAVPALGQASLTYVDEHGLRKAGEVATVTLAEQVGPEAARYRKADKKCVRLNESATDITPASCAGQKVCRDQAGTLACASCRTFANGCPDFEETRMYATINDPGAKAKPAGGGGGNAARLSQCCTQLAAEARRLGSSPEAGLLQSAAVQCSALVAAAGPNGNAPELGVLRTALAGRKIPAVCAGF